MTNTVEICLKDVPQCEIELMCRTISAAVRRLLEDPKNKEDFEQRKRSGKEVKQ